MSQPDYQPLVGTTKWDQGSAVVEFKKKKLQIWGCSHAKPLLMVISSCIRNKRAPNFGRSLDIQTSWLDGIRRWVQSSWSAQTSSGQLGKLFLTKLALIPVPACYLWTRDDVENIWNMSVLWWEAILFQCDIPKTASLPQLCPGA